MSVPPKFSAFGRATDFDLGRNATTFLSSPTAKSRIRVRIPFVALAMESHAIDSIVFIGWIQEALFFPPWRYVSHS
jgi:hypothetical protein